MSRREDMPEEVITDNMKNAMCYCLEALVALSNQQPYDIWFVQIYTYNHSFPHILAVEGFSNFQHTYV